MKKFNLFKVLILVSCITFFAIACKKELTTENKNPIENAKSWYIDHKSNSKTAFKASNDATESIATQFDWDNAKVYNFSDGKEVIATPVKMAKPNNKTVPGSFMLLIYKTDNQYHSQIIYNENDNYFSKTATKSDIEASFMIGQKNNELRSLAKSKATLSNPSGGKIMNMPIDETLCIDWYLIETITWPDGYVSVDETYLYTTCPSVGGGGGGGGSEPEDEPLWGDVINESNIDPIDTAALNLANINSKEKEFNWKVYSAPGGIEFTARQKIYLKTQAFVVWTIDHLDNIGISSTGSSQDSRGWSVSPSVVSWTDSSSWNFAKGTLTFKDTRSKMKYGTLANRYKTKQAYGEWLMSTFTN